MKCPLKVVIIHNDLPAYWKVRLKYLHGFFAQKGISFYAVELFGRGSPYFFDKMETAAPWFTCVFPENSSDELSGKDIKKGLFAELAYINPDVVIGPSIVFFAGAIGLCWAKNNKKRFIMYEDSRPSQIKKNVLVRWIKNAIARQADGIWFPSKEYDEDYCFLRSSGAHFFYGFSCVDNASFAFAGKKRVEHNVILCVARLVPVKNIGALLRAWQVVEQKWANAKLVVVGGGPQFDNLNLLSKTLGLNKVEFTGAVGYGAVAEYYFAAGAFVLPSLREAWGLVVNEAMAAGLPVLLSSNVNAARSLLKEGVNGFTFNPLDISDIAETIGRFINLDDQSKISMSEKSLEIVSCMSFDKMGAQLMDALVTITGKNIRRPGLLASALVNLWHGRYNKARWDEV